MRDEIAERILASTTIIGDRCSKSLIGLAQALAWEVDVTFPILVLLTGRITQSERAGWLHQSMNLTYSGSGGRFSKPSNGEGY